MYNMYCSKYKTDIITDEIVEKEIKETMDRLHKEAAIWEPGFGNEDVKNTYYFTADTIIEAVENKTYEKNEKHEDKITIYSFDMPPDCGLIVNVASKKGLEIARKIENEN